MCGDLPMVEAGRLELDRDESSQVRVYYANEATRA
jgi:putative component of toxin-antitoxin plasmid stabilization module